MTAASSTALMGVQPSSRSLNIDSGLV